ncbi:MAG: shikimate kinase [Clostridia bacterium]
MKRNIILTGFMGTGKSTVGQILAKNLGYEFLDTDAFIEREEGRSISDIFRDDGEHYFRQLETKLVLRIRILEGVVVATGGGMILKPEHRNWFREKGIIVCLDAKLDTLLKNLADSTHRPLLDREAEQDREWKIQKLYYERKKAYMDADWICMIDDKTPQQVAREIVDALAGQLK